MNHRHPSNPFGDSAAPVAYGLPADVIEFIVDKARDYGLEKVVLYGSRGRGDNKPTSDIDLALSGPGQDQYKIALIDFCPTLLEFDFADLDDSPSDGLLELVKRDGKTLYEKSAS